MPAGKMEESRDRNRPLRVFVSDRERAEVETRAAATGLSVSAYLRNLGLGFQPHSTLDQKAILAPLKVNADQGRLGGLFKVCAIGAKRAVNGGRGYSGCCSPPSRTASCKRKALIQQLSRF